MKHQNNFALFVVQKIAIIFFLIKISNHHILRAFLIYQLFLKSTAIFEMKIKFHKHQPSPSKTQKTLSLKITLLNSIHRILGECAIIKTFKKTATRIVFLVSTIKNNAQYVVKANIKNSSSKLSFLLEKHFEGTIQQQANIQIQINHQNILQCIDYYSSQQLSFMVLPYCQEGTLSQFLSQDLQPKQIKTIIYQIAMGLNELHHKKIIHRDIKPQNILIKNKSVKISDFGCAILNKNSCRVRGVYGTLGYMAPQIFEQYDQKVDIWSFGCMIYYILTKKSPFAIKTLKEIKKIINESCIHKKISQLQVFQSQYKGLTHLLSNMLQQNPTKRFDISQIISHQFFKSQEELNEIESPKLKRKQSKRIIDTLNTLEETQKPQSLQKSIQTDRSFFNIENDSNLLNTRLSKFINKSKQSKSSTTSQGSLRSQRLQKITAKRQNLSKDMQQNEAYMIEQNRPLVIKNLCLSPLNISGMKNMQMFTSYGKIKIDEMGFTKFAQSQQQADYKNIQFRISPDGEKVEIKKGVNVKILNLSSLPEKYVKLYGYCKDVVHIIKDNTIKIKLQIDENIRLAMRLNGRITLQINGLKYDKQDDIPTTLQNYTKIMQCCKVIKGLSKIF